MVQSMIPMFLLILLGTGLPESQITTSLFVHQYYVVLFMLLPPNLIQGKLVSALGTESRRGNIYLLNRQMRISASFQSSMDLNEHRRRRKKKEKVELYPVILGFIHGYKY